MTVTPLNKKKIVLYTASESNAGNMTSIVAAGLCARVCAVAVSYLFEELIHEVVPVDLHHLLIIIAVLSLQPDREKKGYVI